MAQPPCHLLSVTLALLSLAHLAISSSSHRRHGHSAPLHNDPLSSDPLLSDSSQDGQDSVPLSHTYTEITGQCDSCPTREQQKEARSEFLKQKILRQLGLQAPPNITVNRTAIIPAIPALSRVRDDYDMQGMAPYHPGSQDDYYDDDYDDGQKKAPLLKLLISQPPPDFVVGGNSQTDIYFQFRSDLLPSHVSVAKLHLYIRGTTSGDIGTSVLLVQAIMPDGQTQVLRKKRIMVGGYRNGEWIIFNIRSQVRHWLAHPSTNVGLRIQVLDMGGNNLALIRPRAQPEEAYIPVLELKDFPPSRRRRDMSSGMMCHENSTESNCCRFPLRVDFSKFGWDWIIAPRKYNANYCSGKCGFVFKTTHRVTHIVQQSIPPNQAHAGPCCAPRKLKPLHLVYFSEEQQIIWGRLAGMIVEDCGCA